MDENLPPRKFFPLLNEKFNLKHITSDLKKESLPDAEVYKFATQQKRLIITYNYEDFKELASQNKNSGVIGISPNLSFEHIDKKLSAFLNAKKPKQLYGALHKITR